MGSARWGGLTARLPLAVALVLTGCSAAPGGSPEASSAPSEPAPTASDTGAPTATASAAASVDALAEAAIEIPGEPDLPLEGFGSVWFLAPDSDEPAMVRVDPETNEVIASIPIEGRTCQGFTVTDDAVWTCTTDGAARIDPATNAITGTVAFATVPVVSRFAHGAGSVWALGSDDGAPNALVRIDPSTMTAATIPLGHGVATVAYGFDAVWVTAPQDGLVLRIDPANEEITEHATGLARPWTIAVGPDSLWVTLTAAEEPEPDEPTVARIDPGDGSVLAEITTGASSGREGGLWADADAVWVRAPDQFLTRIDPVTDEVVDTVSGPSTSGDVTVAFGSVWATAGQRFVVYRLAP